MLNELKSGVAIFIDRKIIWSNRAFAFLFGKAPENIIGQSIESLFEVSVVAGDMPDGENEPRKVYDAVLKTGKRAAVRVSIEEKPVAFSGRDARMITVLDGPTDTFFKGASAREHNLLLSMFDAIDEVIYVADMQTHDILFLNAMGMKYWPDWKGKKCYRVFQNSDEPCSFCTNKVIEKEGQVIWEYANQVNGRVYRCIDKKIHWPDGRDVRFELAIDLTDLKNAQEDIRRNREIFELYFKNATDVLYSIDTEGHILNVSPSVFETLGYRPEELIGKSIFGLNIFEGDELSRVIRDQLRIFSGKTLEREVYYFRTKSGETTIGEINASPLIIDGKVIASFAVARNITDRKIAEDDLKRERDLLTNIMKTSPVAIFITDEIGIITFANARAGEILGRPTEEIIGKNCNDPQWNITDYEGAEYPLEKMPLNRVKESRSSIYGIRLKVHKVKGAGVMLSINATPLHDSSGRFIGMVAVAEDVTEEILMLEQLVESEETFKRIFEFSPNAMVLMDIDNTRIFEANQNFYQLTGYVEQEVIGSKCDELGFFQSCNSEDVLAAIGKTGEIKGYELAGVTRHGQKRDLLIYCRKISQRGGEMLIMMLVDITERKKIEGALLESERRFRQVAENARAWLWEVDNQGEYKYISETVENTLGYKPDELIGKRKVTDLLHPDHRERVMEKIVRKFKKPGPFRDFISPAITANGEIKWLSTSGIPIFGDDGKHLGFTGVDIDVTDRQRTEQALAESEERFRQMANAIEVTFFIFSIIEQKHLYVSPSWEKIYEREIDELMRNPGTWLEVIHESDRERVIKHTIEGKGKKQEIEYRIVTPGGRIKWIRDCTFPIFNERDELISMAGFAEDITAQKQAQREMKLMTTAMKTTHVGITITDIKGRILYANPAEAIMHGFDVDQLVGRDLGILAPQRQRNRRSMLDEDPNSTWDRESINIKRDGTEFPVYLRTSKVVNEENEIIGQVTVCEDITEKKRKEEEAKLRQRQLVQSDKLASLGTLVSGVAHDINNPNQFILSHISPVKKIWNDALPILDRYFRENGDFKIGGRRYSVARDQLGEMFSGISEGARRIDNIVNELKDFAKEGKSGLDESVIINNVVRSAIILVSSQIKNSTDNFTVSYGKGIPTIKGNHQKLEQVIINLLLNACQALGDRKFSIRISTEFDADSGNILITVSDNGLGIDPGIIDKIVEPFFTTKRNKGGTGLGLSISNGIINEHGGRLAFESSLGTGTTAIVTLPVL